MKNIIAKLNSDHIVAILNACLSESFDTIVGTWMDAPTVDIDSRGVFDLYDAIRSYEWNNTTRIELENACKYALYAKVMNSLYASRAFDIINACNKATEEFVNIVW